MSIIHDAMKKAGKEKGGRAFGPTVQSGPEPSSSGKGSAWGVLLVLAVLAIAASAILAPDFFKSLGRPQAQKNSWHTPTTPNAATAMRPAPKGVLGQFGVEEMPRNTGFTLSGIATGGAGHPYGIINGQIVEQGQQINGATVKSITAREVALDFNGEQIILAGSETF